MKKKNKEEQQQSIIGMIITNENPKRIKVNTEYDREYRIFRINVKFDKNELYKTIDRWADEKQITRGILISLKEKIKELE